MFWSSFAFHRSLIKATRLTDFILCQITELLPASIGWIHLDRMWLSSPFCCLLFGRSGKCRFIKPHRSIHALSQVGVGDVGIMLAAFWVVAALSKSQYWVQQPTWRQIGVFTLVEFCYTAILTCPVIGKMVNFFNFIERMGSFS